MALPKMNELKSSRWKSIRCKLFRSKAHQKSHDTKTCKAEVHRSDIQQPNLNHPTRADRDHLQTNQPSQYGLEWDRGEAVWTETPDIDTIKVLVAHVMGPRDDRDRAVFGIQSVDASDIRVEFQGHSGYQKLYLISSRRLAKKYMFRATLPVEPFYKTESEVATMVFIRKYTSLPVPLVIDYCSSASNPLKFEWIVQEHMEGTALSETWDGMTFHVKAEFAVQLQRYMNLLQNFDFSWIGHLYYSRCKDRVNGQPAEWLRVSDGQQQNDHEFVIGRIVSPWSFRGKRRDIVVNRGPFVSGSHLMLAKADLQYECLKYFKHHVPSSTDESCCRDQELLKFKPRLLEVCNSIRASEAGRYPHREDEHRVLHHDISDRDIVVQSDPNFCNPMQLSGIINWESVGTIPSWQADFPRFLKGPSDSELQSRWRPFMSASASQALMEDRQKADLRRIYGDPLRPAVAANMPEKLQQCAEILQQSEANAECCWLADVPSFL